MRRVATALCILGLAGFAVFALGAGGGGGSNGNPTYWVELDNAFGLVQGGDLKIAGVRAGVIKQLKLDKNTLRALVQFRITQNGFGSMRADATCNTRPQSLIGEYYLDCEPGTSSRLLPSGSLIPVTQTTSTVAPDLVNDILRQPYKERLRILLNEFGAGTAGNAANLNAAIRRASPALRETDQVLAILGQQNRILANLATEGDAVISALANNRANVVRFVDTANRTATITATRTAQLQSGFHQLPGFLEQLTPTMHALGLVADRTTPTLQNLDAAAPQLKLFLDQLGPFAHVSLPAFRALGRASLTGNQAVTAATPTVAQLSQFAAGVPELSNNLQIVLGHLDNRAYSAEADPRSAGGLGFTGLEALLNYVFWQSTAINSFDANNHLLSVALFVSAACSQYPDPVAVRAAAQNPSNPLSKCITWLGPSQPGVTTPDPTAVGALHASKSLASAAAPAPAPSAGAGPQQQAPAAPQQSAPPSTASLPLPTGPVQLQLPSSVQQLLSGVTSGVQQTLGSLLHPDPRAQQTVLDYLLGP